MRKFRRGFAGEALPLLSWSMVQIYFDFFGYSLMAMGLGYMTGLWHGADWNLIIWGMFFFVLLTEEKLFLGKYLSRMLLFNLGAFKLQIFFKFFGRYRWSDDRCYKSVRRQYPKR